MTAPQYLPVTEADREVYISFSRPARESALGWLEERGINA